MGLEKYAKHAAEFAQKNSGKAAEALKSEKAEHVSDKLLDGAAGLANRVTGGKFADRVESSREAADKQIGNE